MERRIYGKTFQQKMKKQKYYVVWAGVSPGIYDSWTDCQLQTKGYEGAQFKSFDTRAEAERAFASPPHEYIGHRPARAAKREAPQAAEVPLPEAVHTGCLVVDAACSGNPGQMEYRGMYLPAGQQVFHLGPMYGTNNIGEFLAIVHALKCKTKLPRNAKSEPLFRLIERAEKWLREHTYTPPLKWETEQWGEIPADFGRKK